MRVHPLAAVAIVLASCGPRASDENPPVDTLGSLGLFTDAVEQTPAPGVTPYDVIAVLYADEAEKLRFISIPDGTAAAYDPVDMWSYPDGTTLIKTFFYWRDARFHDRGRRLLETRIIQREAGAWTGRTYVWNDEQTDAVRVKVGQTLPATWIDALGASRSLGYRVPNENECKTCHAKDHVFEPLGPRTRQLNRDMNYGTDGSPEAKNQIDHFVALGVLAGDVPPAAERLTLSDPFGTDPLELRARSYLDANCSHCHRPGGEAESTALDLRFETTDPFALGACRTPVAAGPGSGGRNFDVVPGDPDASVMPFRMASTDPELKMPQLPTQTPDAAGLALIRAWIQSMPARACQ